MENVKKKRKKKEKSKSNISPKNDLVNIANGLIIFIFIFAVYKQHLRDQIDPLERSDSA